MTYLAIPIKVTDQATATETIARAVAAGAEMIELRLDYLTETTDSTREIASQVIAAAKDTNLPIIATCRAQWEGGAFTAGEKSRKALIKHAVRAGVDYIDIESACRNDGEMQIAELVGKNPVGVIRSNHDFEGVPDDLSDRISRVNAHNPDVGKIAYLANRTSDCFAALDWMHAQVTAGKEVIAMAMGEPGQMTRLLAKKLGAFLTFASLDDAQGTAPGQVTAEQILKTFRWNSITPETDLFGVIGCPVGHSLSPILHNAAFDAKGFDGLYLPLLVEPSWEEFKALLEGFRARPWLSFRGLSVTIPHKDNALRYVEETGGELEPLARKIGAVNTLTIDKDGTVRGCNTDYAGALDAITAGGGISWADLAGLPVAVVGAGGVARAVVAGLTDVGAGVTIFNRTESRAAELAGEFGCEAGPLGALGGDFAVLVNCTSLGMHPNVDGTAVERRVLNRDMLVFDTVYNPLETRLLREAREVGAQTVDGVSMFVNQAAVQFRLFTGIEPPMEIMREVVLRCLAV